jgi:hypothetical protein
MNCSLSFIVGSAYSQLVHSGLEMAKKSSGARIADVKDTTPVPLVP